MGPIKSLAVMEATALECFIVDNEVVEMTVIYYLALVGLLLTEHMCSACLDPQRSVFQT